MERIRTKTSCPFWEKVANNMKLPPMIVSWPNWDLRMELDEITKDGED